MKPDLPSPRTELHNSCKKWQRPTSQMIPYQTYNKFDICFKLEKPPVVKNIVVSGYLLKTWLSKHSQSSGQIFCVFIRHLTTLHVKCFCQQHPKVKIKISSRHNLSHSTPTGRLQAAENKLIWANTFTLPLFARYDEWGYAVLNCQEVLSGHICSGNGDSSVTYSTISTSWIGLEKKSYMSLKVL